MVEPAKPRVSPQIEIDQQHASPEGPNVGRDAQGQRRFPFPETLELIRTTLELRVDPDSPSVPTTDRIASEYAENGSVRRCWSGRIACSGRSCGTRPTQEIPSASAASCWLRNPRSSRSRITASQLPPIAKTINAGRMKRIGLWELGRFGTPVSKTFPTPDEPVSCLARNSFRLCRRRS